MMKEKFLFKLSHADRRLLEQLAAYWGENLSATLRRLLRNQARAIGLLNGPVAPAPEEEVNEESK
ncbi:MAG: hypothetical protein KF893_01320 [Caldilineaceae bacterium]|nr:hypothetical protein [Caldilineaceae bacterium]